LIAFAPSRPRRVKRLGAARWQLSGEPCARCFGRAKMLKEPAKTTRDRGDSQASRVIREALQVTRSVGDTHTSFVPKN